MDRTSVNLGGRQYVIVARDEFDRLVALANAPTLPEANDGGDVPAVGYARASLARKLVRRRVDAGLSQRELAKLAGVREETICRIEGGKNTPSIATIDKIEAALRSLAAGVAGRGGRGGSGGSGGKARRGSDEGPRARPRRASAPKSRGTKVLGTK